MQRVDTCVGTELLHTLVSGYNLQRHGILDSGTYWFQCLAHLVINTQISSQVHPLLDKGPICNGCQAPQGLANGSWTQLCQQDHPVREVWGLPSWHSSPVSTTQVLERCLLSKIVRSTSPHVGIDPHSSR